MELKKPFLILSSLCLVFLLLSCSGKDKSEDVINSSKVEPNVSSVAPIESSSGENSSSVASAVQESKSNISAPDLGDFKIVFSMPKDESLIEVRESLMDVGVFNDSVLTLSDALSLPKDILVNFTECGVVDSYYDPKSSQVVMCYELVGDIAYLLSDQNLSEDVYGEAVVDSTEFTMYRELAHAMIDVYGLPIGGNKNDLTDQLATYLIVESGEAGSSIAVNGAYFFSMQGRDVPIEEQDFYDRNSVDTKRFQQVSCWVYGKDSQGNKYLVDDGYVANDRAAGCADEYALLSHGVGALLSKYNKY